MTYWDIISLSTIGLYFIPITLYIVTYNYNHIIALLGLIITPIISESIKFGIIGKKSPRPFKALNCNLLCNDGNQSGRPGMPSSHSAQVAFFTGFYTLYYSSPFLSICLISYAVIVMISRYMKKCHTISQIIVGGILGLVLSASFIKLKKQAIS